MTTIRPFRSWHYDFSRKDLCDVIAPPYDVISTDHRERLLKRNPENSIRLILGDPSLLTPEERNDPRRYEGAADTWDTWKKTHVLVQDSTPTMYCLEDTFEWRGETVQRVGLLALLKLTPFGKGVFPHERTLQTPIEDQLKLMRTTKAQLSPIFVLFDDPVRDAAIVLSDVMKGTPIAVIENKDEKIRHRLWKIDRPVILDRLEALLSVQPVVIADGHHRYTTALHENPEGYVYTYLAPISSSGVVLGGIHRRFDTSVSKSELLQKLPSNWRTAELSNSYDEFLKSGAPLALLDPIKQQATALIPPPPLDTMSTKLLDEQIVRPILGMDLARPEDQSRVKYIKAPEEAWLGAEKGLTLWVRPLQVSDVLSVAKTEQVLPQKSTFFYPKVMSGFLFRDLLDPV